MRIAGINSCSLVNGEGVRFVIFVQGCAHRCVGCQNPDTWDFGGGYEITPQELVAQIKAHKFIDGITLSGGDPYFQENECVRLIAMLPKHLNVWVYTGYEYKDIKTRPLTKAADVVVTGPFVESLRCEGKHYGSSNQEIHRRNEMINVGKAMRETREDMGLTPIQLSELSGVALRSIEVYERGEVLPGIKNLILLADALETTIDDYIGRQV